jgi:hypothetical protein
MITNSQNGLAVFAEALAKTLIHKGVFEKSELVKQLEEIRDHKERPPAEQSAYAGEIDMQITRVRDL